MAKRSIGIKVNGLQELGRSNFQIIGYATKPLGFFLIPAFVTPVDLRCVAILSSAEYVLSTKYPDQ